jgi:redox-sensitive bicupin YhaK (pirin superfamily)
MQIRRSNDRGRSDYGWLDSRHTFSFADYYDPENKGVSVLRVINDDTVAPGAGFETHSHWNMEIISYILAGAIEHKDSMGNITRLEAGDVQVMTTGTGVTHSEYNPSADERLHFLQIWIRPSTRDLPPAYEQKAFAHTAGRQTLASPDRRDGSLLINQDAVVDRLQLPDGSTDSLQLSPCRTGFLHVIRGRLTGDDIELAAGDGLTISDPVSLAVTAQGDTEALWFDLP